MDYILETIGLAVTGFIILVFTAVYHLTATMVKGTFMPLYNSSGFGGVANPILSNIVIYGYIACLIFFVGAIILYLVKSHESEYESYEERMYNQR